MSCYGSWHETCEPDCASCRRAEARKAVAPPRTLADWNSGHSWSKAEVELIPQSNNWGDVQAKIALMVTAAISARAAGAGGAQ